MRHILVLLAALVATSSCLLAQKPGWPPGPGHTTLNVWPNGAPGASANLAPEADTTTAKDNLIAGKPLIRLGNVSTPTLTIYSPRAGKNTGVSRRRISRRWLSHPGDRSRRHRSLRLAQHRGDHLRFAQVPRAGYGPYPKSAAALQDAQRAVGIVRSHAAEWHIDPKRIGVLGFSAGAHLAAALSTHFDKRLYDVIDAADQASCRPDFAVIVYPGYLAIAEQNFAANAEIHPTEQTPPSFIVQAEDDPVHVENATVYFLALKNAQVPAELHIYAQGGHGYGLRRTELPVTGWPRLVETWLRTIQILPAAAH